MNRYIYSLLLLLLSPIALLYLGYRALKSPAYNRRLQERFGYQLPQVKAPIVVHCASVGETLAALPLIRLLLQHYPHVPLLVTTTTPTGSAMVQQHLGSQVHHCYLPVDLNGSVKRFLTTLSPTALLLLETELWPNLIHHCHQRQIPIMLINGRLSARTAAKYQRFPKLIGPLLQQLSVAAMQHSSDGERLRQLGMSPEHIHECGSLKFDVQLTDTERQWAQQQSQALWGTRPSWVAASTHPGEFEQVIHAHQQLLQQQPQLLLVLVPRHPEQFQHAQTLLEQAGLHYQTRSSQRQIHPTTQVLLGDTMGELKQWYGGCDLAFVGGSLIDRGGHNPLEAIAYGKPVFMGPSSFNFQAIVEALQNQGLLFPVADGNDLALQLQKLLTQPEHCANLRTQALAFIQQNSGAAQRQLAVIAPLLAHHQASN
ncbi:MAG: lipid IV(A) 3-deoxy-D-manno-octulosonic acid transferase [Ferrimonas sp.]